MRNLVYAINGSIDGCCDHAKMNGDEEIHEYLTNLIRNAGPLLYGRVTYQLMVPFWPDVARNQSMSTVSNEFARVFDSVGKVVFSKSLDQAEGNTRIIRGNLREEVLKLKQEEGKNILVGGVDLPSQLIDLGLVDEYYFVVQPSIVGEGRRLLDGIKLREKLKLKLADARTLKSGCLALHYLKI